MALCEAGSWTHTVSSGSLVPFLLPGEESQMERGLCGICVPGALGLRSGVCEPFGLSKAANSRPWPLGCVGAPLLSAALTLEGPSPDEARLTPMSF